jgi:hypothetical protein
MRKHLLEEPVDLGAADIKRSNVVEDGGGDVDAVGAAAGAQVDDAGGGLVAVALDGDPSEGKSVSQDSLRLPFGS